MTSSKTKDVLLDSFNVWSPQPQHKTDLECFDSHHLYNHKEKCEFILT